MPIETHAGDDALWRFLASCVAECPQVRRLRRRGSIRLSPLFEVRSPSVAAVADGGLVESAVLRGWWAFLLREEQCVGIAELRLASTAITFAGVEFGALGRRAAKALAEVEGYARGPIAVWFLEAAPLFFTGIVAEWEGRQRVISLARRARSRDSIETCIAARAHARLKAKVLERETLKGYVVSAKRQET